MSGSKRTAQSRAIEGELLRATPPKIRLSDLDSTRREMAAVYRLMRSGKLDTQDGTRLVYVLSQIGKLIEAALVEGRVCELERLLAGEQSATVKQQLYMEDE